MILLWNWSIWYDFCCYLNAHLRYYSSMLLLLKLTDLTQKGRSGSIVVLSQDHGQAIVRDKWEHSGGWRGDELGGCLWWSRLPFCWQFFWRFCSRRAVERKVPWWGGDGRAFSWFWSSSRFYLTYSRPKQLSWYSLWTNFGWSVYGFPTATPHFYFQNFPSFPHTPSSFTSGPSLPNARSVWWRCFWGSSSQRPGVGWQAWSFRCVGHLEEGSEGGGKVVRWVCDGWFGDA